MLDVKILKDSDYLWVDIKGKLIIEEDGKNMFEQIISNISEECSNIVLNLKDLEYINSSGFNNLLKILTKSRNLGGDTFLCNINSVIDPKIRQLTPGYYLIFNYICEVNEISLDSSYIGAINLHEKHSFVQLPKGIPEDLFKQLKGVRVRRQPLAITTSDEQVVRQETPRRTERPQRNN